MKKYLFVILLVSFNWGKVEEGISYYASGLKKHHRSYENKVANGKWIYWYDNGQKWIEGSHKNNERNGEWIFYKEDGTVYEVKVY